jgi:hypothetical protein
MLSAVLLVLESALISGIKRQNLEWVLFVKLWRLVWKMSIILYHLSVSFREYHMYLLVTLGQDLVVI